MHFLCENHNLGLKCKKKMFFLSRDFCLLIFCKNWIIKKSSKNKNIETTTTQRHQWMELSWSSNYFASNCKRSKIQIYSTKCRDSSSNNWKSRLADKRRSRRHTVRQVNRIVRTVTRTVVMTQCYWFTIKLRQASERQAFKVMMKNGSVK